MFSDVRMSGRGENRFAPDSPLRGWVPKIVVKARAHVLTRKRLGLGSRWVEVDPFGVTPIPGGMFFVDPDSVIVGEGEKIIRINSVVCCVYADTTK
jgi:hypothetical protein